MHALLKGQQPLLPRSLHTQQCGKAADGERCGTALTLTLTVKRFPGTLLSCRTGVESHGRQHGARGCGCTITKPLLLGKCEAGN